MRASLPEARACAARGHRPGNGQLRAGAGREVGMEQVLPASQRMADLVFSR